MTHDEFWASTDPGDLRTIYTHDNRRVIGVVVRCVSGQMRSWAFFIEVGSPSNGDGYIGYGAVREVV